MLAHPVTKLHSENTQHDPNLNIRHPENLNIITTKVYLILQHSTLLFNGPAMKGLTRFLTSYKMHKSLEVAKVYYPNI